MVEQFEDELDQYEKDIEDRQSRGGGSKYDIIKVFKPVVGANFIRAIDPYYFLGCPELRKKFFIEIITHYNLGSEGKVSLPCLKKDPSDPDDLCPACEFSTANRSSEIQEEKDYGYNIRGTKKPLIQLIDLTPAYSKSGIPSIGRDGTLVIPDCWVSKYDYKDAKCTNCAWKKSCDYGVIPYPVPQKLFDFIFLAINRSLKQRINMMDLEKGYNFSISRVGTTKQNTKYTPGVDIQFSALPAHVIKVVRERIVNLTEWNEKQKVTYEKMAQILVEEAEPEHPADEISNQPDCVGDYWRDGHACPRGGLCNYEKKCMDGSTRAGAPATSVAPPPNTTGGGPGLPGCFRSFNEDSVKCGRCELKTRCTEKGPDHGEQGKETPGQTQKANPNPATGAPGPGPSGTPNPGPAGSSGTGGTPAGPGPASPGSPDPGTRTGQGTGTGGGVNYRDKLRQKIDAGKNKG